MALYEKEDIKGIFKDDVVLCADCCDDDMIESEEFILTEFSMFNFYFF